MAQRSKNPIPQAPGQVPSQDKNFREFDGINTQAARQAINPTQFAWLENVMPVGHGNAKTVPAISSVLQTLSGLTIYYEHEFNISNTSYTFYATTSGAAYQVLNSSPYTATLIAAAATFPASGTQITQWKNERILIITSANYYDWDGASLTTLGGTKSAPTGGQCIAVYAGHVWISNGRTIYYSKPAAYDDFAAPGGNTIITDPTLTSDIKQLYTANNFLYFFGINSINVIADVSINSAGTATLFSNTNISANSGTDLAQTIFAYYRAIWYMNESGIYGLYGATPRKASDDLDGIFPLIDFTLPVTGGSVNIFNILCAAFMFTYNDPTLGARKIVAVYFNEKWFIVSATNIKRMHTVHQPGNDYLFSTDDSNIYQMVSNTSANISQTMVSALWDFDNFVRKKDALKVGTEVVIPAGGQISVTVDTEIDSASPTGNFGGTSEFIWYNSNGSLFTWTNSIGGSFTWLSSGYQWFFADVENQGHYLGITLTSNSPRVIYSGMQLQYRMLPGGWWDD